MLIDVDTSEALSPIMRHIGARPTKILTGMYVNCSFNFHNCVPYDEWDGYWTDDGGVDDAIPEYGVVDSVEQFVRLFGDALEKSPHYYAVGFTTVRKSDQPASGGWRWTKWGEYYGEHEPQHEYLYYENAIDEVVTFTVLRKRESGS